MDQTSTQGPGVLHLKDTLLVELSIVYKALHPAGYKEMKSAFKLNTPGSWANQRRTS